MRLTAFWGAALLASISTAGAWAQDSWAPTDCADLEAGSFEAEMLDCGSKARTPDPASSDSRQVSGTERAPAVASPEPDGVATERRPESSPEGEVERPAKSQPLPSPEVRRPEVEVIPPEADLEDIQPEVELREGRGRGAELQVPKGHRPPPGMCRLWFPDRPPGHQPPPTGCDVEVPQGAALIRG